MANSITQYAIDFIYAKISGGKVRFGNLARYVTRYQPMDFADDDLVTKYYVDSSFPTTNVPSLIALPAGTALPYSIAYNTSYSQYGNDPTIQVRLSTGQDVSASATLIFGSAIPLDTVSVDVNNDGTGITASDMTIIIKN